MIRMTTKTGGLRGMVSVAAGVMAALGLSAFAAAAAQPKVVITFDPTLGQLPESMTADEHGNLYASNISGAIQKIDPQTQAFVTVATVPLPAGASLTGIKIGPDGLIYVASANFAPDPDGAFVWRVSPQSGDVHLFASLDANGFPNDLVFQDDGTLLVTDPFLAQIWKIDPAGHASVWLSDALFAGDPAAPAFGAHAFGVDGIAFDHNKRNLYVGNVDFGRLMRIPVEDHCAPRIEVVVEDPALKGIDGIAIDRRGTIFAAVNAQDSIATVAKDGAISVIAQGSPLDGPSSFAFGTGHQDKQTLYIANFAITRFLTGQTSHPGILSLPVQVPGLPLP
jgi:sugar lactone lactonase YvrE